jgi:hypothetical protein
MARIACEPGSDEVLAMSFALCLRQKRHIASALLFVWLFASIASWANACILQPSAAVQGPHGHASDSHDPDPARQACASFCDIEQGVIAKAQPTQGDGAAPPSVCWPALRPPRAEIHRRALAAPPPTGPPVAIAFLRLTI